jgi:predicted DNA-binding transcriptional regulator YafY
MAERKTYFASEIADMLGMSVDTFYRERARLHARGMPHSATLGRVRINKQMFDAWLARPQPTQAPANDRGIADAQALLRQAYSAAGRAG